jgi:hypothetical protein
MRKIYILFFVAFLLINVKAQTLPNFDWNIGIGGTGNDEVYDLAVDNNGNTIAVGKFGGTVNFDPSGSASATSTGISDIFVAKYSASGALVWLKTMGGPTQDKANAVKVDANGNVYVIGDFTDSIDYNPGAPGQHTFIGQSGLTDIILFKYNAAGVLQWANQLGGPSIDYSNDLAIDANNNLFATGYFYGTADYEPTSAVSSLTTLGQADVFLAKYDSNGGFIWAKQIGAPGIQSSSKLKVDNTSNIILFGTFHDSPDFDPGPGIDSVANTTQFGNVVYFAKYDNNGNYLWAKGIQGNGFKSIGDVTTDNSGNLYITGNFADVTDFDPDTSVTGVFSIPAPQGNRLIYFAKYSSNGTLIWAKNIEHPNLGGQDLGVGIALDAQNNIYLTGQFWGQGCDFDPSSAVNPTAILGSNASNNYDGYIAKYTNSGNYIWAKSFGDAGDDRSNVILFDASNSMYIGARVAGNASPSIDMDITSGTSFYNLGLNNGNDFTITKYSNCFVNPAVVLNGTTLSAFQNGAAYQWLNCTVGYLTVSGATSQSFTPTTSGTYACQISLTGCSDTTICTYVNTCNVNTNSTLSGTTITAVAQTGATYQWVNCGIGYAPIPGATSTTFTANASGTYAAIITLGNCSDTTSCETVNICNINTNVTTNNLTLTVAATAGASYQWLNCSNNYSAIAGQTAQTFTGVFGGNYAVAISLNGCVDTTICYSINACGVNKNVAINGVTLSSLESAATVTYKWLKCNTNGTFTAISGATSQSYTATANGSYAVAVTLNNCTDTSDCALINNVGIYEYVYSSSITLYPNPAHNLLTAQIDNNVNVNFVTIYDITGKEVMTMTVNSINNIDINVEGLAKGIYTIKFINKSKENIAIKRFIKQ